MLACVLFLFPRTYFTLFFFPSLSYYLRCTGAASSAGDPGVGFNRYERRHRRQRAHAPSPSRLLITNSSAETRGRTYVSSRFPTGREKNILSGAKRTKKKTALQPSRARAFPKGGCCSSRLGFFALEHRVIFGFAIVIQWHRIEFKYC